MVQLKALSVLFRILALLLSHAMCAVIAYNYCNLAWGVQYAVFTTEKELAFLWAIPFLVAILFCIFLARFFKKKSGQ